MSTALFLSSSSFTSIIVTVFVAVAIVVVVVAVANLWLVWLSRTGCRFGFFRRPLSHCHHGPVHFSCSTLFYTQIRMCPVLRVCVYFCVSHEWAESLWNGRRPSQTHGWRWWRVITTTMPMKYKQPQQELQQQHEKNDKRTSKGPSQCFNTKQNAYTNLDLIISFLIFFTLLFISDENVGGQLSFICVFHALRMCWITRKHLSPLYGKVIFTYVTSPVRCECCLCVRFSFMFLLNEKKNVY